MENSELYLQRYLEIEKILNDFYQYFDYCLEKCIKPAIGINNGPVAVCCKDKYYKKYDLEDKAFDLLRDEREIRYGKPDQINDHSGVSPCEYHTSVGCALKTHKSPICLSFMCRKSIDNLRDRFNIFQYDYLGFNYALEWILTGDMTGIAYAEFKDSCLDMITKIKNPKKN
ncbi:MAG: hypothetical protein GY714_24040 [Desulfobacterales bacterium]|nr:hypothetical protein [Desulfobacterales bacterium]MCP4163584.1 hypothetical protein [Deltaproteobacteria bacterium]